MTRLRSAALLSAQIAAAVSVAFLLRAAHRNPSILLLVLMAIWVVAPFAGLLGAIHIWGQRWLQILTLFVTVGAVAIYTIDALGPPRVKAATVFVLVPLVSWILGGIIVAIVVLSAKRRAD